MSGFVVKSDPFVCEKCDQPSRPYIEKNVRGRHGHRCPRPNPPLVETPRMDWEVERDDMEGLSELATSGTEEIEALHKERRETHAAVVAYIRDRAGQYDQGSGIGAALNEIAAKIHDYEHLEAFRHGELDDLIEGQS